ncbi:BTAD domain-containing putative transcriptional regulator, partial [Streptomyces sp. NPDC031705]|uniref:AfsR/SARP family transcriptional regulator n=1 Tax=Streptomyces sp. NPDC031705 TaxID=3155729 RepID=UPI0033FB8914
MEFRVLGTVSVVAACGKPVQLGPAKRRSLLAVLLLRPNAAVGVDRLTRALWDEDPPRHSRTVLQGHVSRLRALFAEHGAPDHGVELLTQGTAYALRLPESLVDAHRFGQLHRLAREQREPARAVRLLREALALWEGPALGGTVGGPLLEAAAHGLDELRLTAVEELAGAHALLGEHAAAAALLRAEAVLHPLREPLIAALVLALGRSGRRSDALDWYHRTRRLLADQLGVDPGAVLSDAYTALLRADAPAPPLPATAATAVGVSAAAPGTAPRKTGTEPGRPNPEAAEPVPAREQSPPRAGRTAPAPGETGPGGTAHAGTGHAGMESAETGPGEMEPVETEPVETGAAETEPAETVPPAPFRPGPPEAPQLLPRWPRGFTGRTGELAELDRAAAGDTAPILMLTGSAGVGKTALALHWAHRHRADFPGGRLFADLHGYSPLPARDTASVLREFLLALGVPTERMPDSAPALGARYRELTRGRRMLVVLDNARDSAQVRPLLPGGDACVTLVTSRSRLGELVVSDAARPVPVRELPAAQSTELLAAVLGPDAVAAEPEAAVRLARLCDGLPLALRLAAARLATRPHRGLAAFAGELADEHTRLDLLNVGSTGVAAALGLTVQHLPEAARRMFHRLGPHTAAALDVPTAAALAGCLPSQAASALDQLAAAQLVVEAGPRSYVLHDLVRLYARSLSPGHDPEGLLRLLDHWLRTLLAACAAAEPGSEPCCALPAGARRAAPVRP